ncbi:hypothetical protein CC53_gp126 [Rhizobium phage vB_RleS_L338C]|nr:hypothetical protein CC53_gp126 [Rhizobium phage vB_RleS_L338C]AHC30543.1 hypothetical protein L338C_126 [Rhizobium phage vB_RleS_L338C]QNH72203.1 hypothetical protein P11VFA_023 [Rhizobium phage P11VFA]
MTKKPTITIVLKPVEPTADELAWDQKVRNEAARRGGVY